MFFLKRGLSKPAFSLGLSVGCVLLKFLANTDFALLQRRGLFLGNAGRRKDEH